MGLWWQLWWQLWQGSVNQSTSRRARCGGKESLTDGGWQGLPCPPVNSFLKFREPQPALLGWECPSPSGAVLSPRPCPITKADLPAHAQANIPGALVPAAKRKTLLWHRFCGDSGIAHDVGCPPHSHCNGGSSPGRLGPGGQGGLCGAECPPAEPENQTKVDKKEQKCHSGRGTAWAKVP